MTARPLYKTDELARANERICRLEARITEMAVELLKTHSRLKAAHDQLRKQQVAIEEAQANAARFHAQLLFERVTKLPQRKAS